MDRGTTAKSVDYEVLWTSTKNINKIKVFIFFGKIKVL